MSEAKHTLGPWTADCICGCPMVWAKTRAGDMKIADVRGWGHLTGGGALKLSEAEAALIQDANAHLLAAAPELLESLKEIVSLTDRQTDIWDKANAVIAKAEGRS